LISISPFKTGLMKPLNKLKENKSVGYDLTLGVSICLDVVSIETLDLAAKKGSVSTVEKILTVSKS
jgi:hypothetical protein